VREPIPSWDKAAVLAAPNIRKENFAVTDGNAQGYVTGAATADCHLLLGGLHCLVRLE
jgi:hypothetical protein